MRNLKCVGCGRIIWPWDATLPDGCTLKEMHTGCLMFGSHEFNRGYSAAADRCREEWVE